MNARKLALAAAVLVLPALFGWQDTARAQGTLFRFYYSNWGEGLMLLSPADPTGAFEEERVDDASRGELEAIFFRRIGLSFSRDKSRREFTDSGGTLPDCAAPPCAVIEETVSTSYNLTAYMGQVEPNGLNAFIGGGVGQVDYAYSINGVVLENPDLHNMMDLTRTFVGFEYEFERVGFRVEMIELKANKSDGAGNSAEMHQRYQFLTIFIPFN